MFLFNVKVSIFIQLASNFSKKMNNSNKIDYKLLNK